MDRTGWKIVGNKDLDKKLKKKLDEEARGLGAGFAMWQPIVSGGKVSVPFTVHPSYAHRTDQIKEAMAEMQDVLGCFETPWVENPMSDVYGQGIVFVAGGSCYSLLGRGAGYHNGILGATSVTDVKNLSKTISKRIIFYSVLDVKLSLVRSTSRMASSFPR